LTFTGSFAEVDDGGQDGIAVEVERGEVLASWEETAVIGQIHSLTDVGTIDGVYA